jgi:hypothetical protein
MPIAARRFIYSLFAVLGLGMMVPFLVGMRRFQSVIMTSTGDPTDLEALLEPASASFGEGAALLFLVGLIAASSFLYLAVTTGYARAWRPKENGTPRCVRCDSEMRFRSPRCPTCDQQLVW